jgi:hypothetical protein
MTQIHVSRTLHDAGNIRQREFGTDFKPAEPPSFLGLVKNETPRTASLSNVEMDAGFEVPLRSFPQKSLRL